MLGYAFVLHLLEVVRNTALLVMIEVVLTFDLWLGFGRTIERIVMFLKISTL